MTWNATSMMTFSFCFVFFSFLAVHHAHMKTQPQYREIASVHKGDVRPWYDASYKM